MRRELRSRRRRARSRRGAGVGRTPLIRGLGVAPGRILTGTSGFAYPGWAPLFYPSGLKDADRLGFYASHLGAVELNNTFYQRPTSAKIAAWCAVVPPGFRFVVKAQRGAAMRALGVDAAASAAWLTERLDGFGDRLGGVLFRVPEPIRRRDDGSSDEALGRLLTAWPRQVPLVLELLHPSWHVDETFAAMRAAGAVLCTSDLPGADVAPDIRVTGSGLYLRLRREDYAPEELAAWADRVRPFLDSGHPVLAFFRHDESGRGAGLAARFRDLVEGG